MSENQWDELKSLRMQVKGARTFFFVLQHAGFTLAWLCLPANAKAF
jgi:hypothetical protein